MTKGNVCRTRGGKRQAGIVRQTPTRPEGQFEVVLQVKERDGSVFELLSDDAFRRQTQPFPVESNGAFEIIHAKGNYGNPGPHLPQFFPGLALSVERHSIRTILTQCPRPSHLASHMSGVRSALIIFLAVFAAGLAVFSRHNDFPFYYHPDEPGKVGQLIGNKRNFHHPMLMLTTADAARRIALPGEMKKDRQQVAHVGRWVIAGFAALAAAALAALATNAHGWLAGIGVGALCVANPLLYELAHYFKEDPALVAGIGLACLGLQRMLNKQDTRGFALLGAATALAASGKYVGFALLPVAVIATILVRNTDVPMRRRFAWMLGAFAIVWLGFNWWIFKSPELIWKSLGEETTKAFGGEDGPSRSVPHSYYLTIQNAYSSPALWVGLGVWALLVAVRRVKVTAAEAVLAGCAVLMFAVFSFTPKTSPRYHLPVSVAISYFAAIGAFGLATLLGRRNRVVTGVLSIALAAALLAAEFPFLKLRQEGFAHDDRAELEAFVREKLPATAVIAQDEAVNLPDLIRKEHEGRTPLSQRVIGKKQIADRGDLDALRKEGVTHLAICARTYGRFIGVGNTPERKFYEDAIKRGTTLLTFPQGVITYLQPGLTLLDITNLK